MKRRNFLKKLTATAAGGVLCGQTSVRVLAAQEGQATASPSAKAIRGLIEKDGKLWQPIQFSFQHSGQDATAVVRVDGVQHGQQTVTAGAQTLEALIPPVETVRTAQVSVEVAGKTLPATVALQPVRRMTLYVLPHSHNDIGYTDVQAAIAEKQMRNLRQGIELARRTAHYPEGSRFIWNMEGLWASDLYMHRMSPADRTEFIEAVRKGWVGLNGMYCNELTGLCRPEELLQMFRYSTELAEQCDVRIDSAMISDVPGYTWGTVTAMAQAGIRYFSAAPNWSDRIGAFMLEWQDKPFWWVSPSGREKVLMWVPWTGYALSHVIKQATPEWVGSYQSRLDKVNFPYDISYIRWSGHGDNATPDPDISEFCKTWNEKYTWPKFVISTTSKAFSAFEQQYGRELPEFKGDLTPYWEDGAGSSARETAMNRSSSDRLVQAETLYAMCAPGAYPVTAFSDAWRNVLLYTEHTWGAWCSVTNPESKFTKDQWEGKRAFVVNADQQSRELLKRPLDRTSTHPAPQGGAVDVLNTTSWPRTELVAIPKELSQAGDCVTDQRGRPVPSQRLATGELAIWASDVPPFCAVRYTLSKGKACRAGTPVKAQIPQPMIDNGLIRARLDEKTGGITELFLRGVENNLAGAGNGEQINEYLFLPGENLADLESNGPVTITVEEKGPLVASLRVESAAPGCNKLIRHIRLVAGASHLELTNVVDKKPALVNPNPSDQKASWDFARHKGKESLQFAFPFNIKQGKMRLDIPLAVIKPEADQLPGSCKNWLVVGRWIDVAGDRQGVTWVTLDAPLVEVGGITANIPGSQSDPDKWRKRIDPAQKFYSWAMNNHWHTNYCADQEGLVTFRYALRPNRGYDPAAAARFATGLSQPLVVAPAAGRVPSRTPLLHVDSADVLVTALKPSDDGKAWIVRLFGASGEDRQVKLVWSSSVPKTMWESDLSERPGARLHDMVTVPAWDIVTVRAERT
jgi:hypothetical protein